MAGAGANICVSFFFCLPFSFGIRGLLFWLGLNGVLLWLMMKKKKSNFFFRRPMNTVIELFNHVPMSVIFNFNIFLANIHPLHTVWDGESEKVENN